MRPLQISAALALALAPALAGAAPGSQPSQPADLSKQVEAAQGGARYDQQAAVRADVELFFGGKPRLSGRMIFDRGVGKSRIEMKSGATLVFDGEKAWVSPQSAEVQRARFSLLTWPYFMAAPFKLNDPGVHLKPAGQMPLVKGGPARPVTRMTFDSGVGDTPDDWYVLYTDDQGRLEAMSYIVTFGKSKEKAEAEPHAIRYHDFKTVDGVTFATRWTFHNWSEKDGIYGEPLGEARLSNIGFVPFDAAQFTAPKDAREDKMP